MGYSTEREKTARESVPLVSKQHYYGDTEYSGANIKTMNIKKKTTKNITKKKCATSGDKQQD